MPFPVFMWLCVHPVGLARRGQDALKSPFCWPWTFSMGIFGAIRAVVSPRFLLGCEDFTFVLEFKGLEACHV